MKAENALKKVLIILLIILISLISFGGIYVQKTKFVENIIPQYKLGADLSGGTAIEFKVNENTISVIYDKDGNVVSEEGEDTVTKEEPLNPPEVLTKENHLLTKEIFLKRLKEMNVEDYTFRFDESNGRTTLLLPNNVDTDIIAQFFAIKGVFTVVNENNEILLNNSHIENAKVGYNTTETGTAIYLSIQFNKEGSQILKDITNTYIKTTDEEGNEQTKKVDFKVDDTAILSTYFEDEIANGIIQFSMGESTSSEDIENYLKEASNLAMLLNTGALPINYSIENMYYIASNITEDMLYIPAIIVAILILIGLVVLIIKYKLKGTYASISFIGFIALLLLALRCFNVVININGIVALLFAILLNYIFTVYLLSSYKKENNKILTRGIYILIPAMIMSVILCFAKWLPLNSFGMVIFWGILLIIIYNLTITKKLIK